MPQSAAIDLGIDPLAAPLAVIGIVIALLAWRYAAHPRLEYTITQRPLVSVDAAVGGRVSVLFDGTPIHDAQLVLIRLANTGRAQISAEAFEGYGTDNVRPLRIRVGGLVVSADIPSSHPPGLSPTLQLRDDLIEIAPLHLNAGERFDIQALVTGCTQVTLDPPRIAGLPPSRIADTAVLASRWDRQLARWALSAVWSVLGLLLGMSLLVSLAWVSAGTDARRAGGIAMFAAFLAFLWHWRRTGR